MPEPTAASTDHTSTSLDWPSAVAGMRFVGIDLAWGQRARTGLCALDSNGDVLSSTRRIDIEEILDWTRPYASGGVVVGVDAPLIVENASGRRPCEAMVDAVFRSREAGTYPSNRGMTAFADGGRGRYLATQLGLCLSPSISVRSYTRKILEVYPHAALVSLFELGKTIKYKARRGRSFDDRRAAFDVLTIGLETLVSREPALRLDRSRDWERLRAEIANAPTRAALDRAEDELDSYVCAYVAYYYWYWGVERCWAFGEEESGHIVTPIDDVARQLCLGL